MSKISSRILLSALVVTSLLLNMGCQQGKSDSQATVTGNPFSDTPSENVNKAIVIEPTNIEGQPWYRITSEETMIAEFIRLDMCITNINLHKSDETIVIPINANFNVENSIGELVGDFNLPVGNYIGIDIEIENACNGDPNGISFQFGYFEEAQEMMVARYYVPLTFRFRHSFEVSNQDSTINIPTNKLAKTIVENWDNPEVISLLNSTVW